MLGVEAQKGSQHLADVVVVGGVMFSDIAANRGPQHDHVHGTHNVILPTQRFSEGVEGLCFAASQ